MTTDQLQRLRNLPSPSEAMREYTEALSLFFEADTPGSYRAPGLRINAKDAMEAAWDALGRQDRDLVRAIAGGTG